MRQVPFATPDARSRARQPEHADRTGAGIGALRQQRARRRRQLHRSRAGHGARRPGRARRVPVAPAAPVARRPALPGARPRGGLRAFGAGPLPRPARGRAAELGRRSVDRVRPRRGPGAAGRCARALARRAPRARAPGAPRAARRLRPRGAVRRAGRPRFDRRARAHRALHQRNRERGMSAGGNGLAILAVDDEPRALADIKHLLETSTSVDRVATATSAKEALVYLSGGRYDALFLDVHMPEIEGMALARLLRRFADPPAVVFVTGHPDAAVEAFEIQALDFLVKPVSRERLEPALARVEAQSRPAPPAGATTDGPAAAAAAPGAGAPDVVAVDNPKGGGKRLVRLETISIAQANGDYARIVCDDGRFLLRTPLSQLEKDWETSGFARVHRAYLVNLTHAVELRAQLNGTAVLVMRDGTEVPVARRNVAALRRRLHA